MVQIRPSDDALIAIGPAKYERVSEMTPKIIDGDFVHVVTNTDSICIWNDNSTYSKIKFFSKNDNESLLMTQFEHLPKCATVVSNAYWRDRDLIR